MSNLATAELIKDATQAVQFTTTLFTLRTKVEDHLDAAKLQKKKIKGWQESVTADQ